MSDIKASSFLKVKYPNLLLVFLLLALLPYLLLSFYIHPVADDFIYALKGEDFLKNLWRDYTTWNGRYTSNVIVFSNTVLCGNLLLYELYPIVLIALLVFSIYWFLNIAFKQRHGRRENLVLALIFVLLFLNLLPKESEGLYWFTGSATYILPCGFFLIYFGLAISYFRNEIFLNKYFHLGCCVLLLFLLCGFNEVLTIVLLLFHLLYSALIRKRFLFDLLFICLAGFSFMLLAPGNSIRSLYFPEKHQFFHSFLYSLLQTVRFSSTWILSPAFLLATIFFLPRAKQDYFSNHISPVVLLLALFSIIFVAAFAPYWTTGILGQHRTINLACFLFLLCWFFILASLSRFIPESFFQIIKTKFFQSSAIILLMVSFFITRNGLTSWADLVSGGAKQFDAELRSRHAGLFECKKQGPIDCAVPALTVFPKSIFVLDIQPQSSSWINIDYARYYGLNSVSIQQ